MLCRVSTSVNLTISAIMHPINHNMCASVVLKDSQYFELKGMFVALIRVIQLSGIGLLAVFDSNTKWCPSAAAAFPLAFAAAFHNDYGLSPL